MNKKSYIKNISKQNIQNEAPQNMFKFKIQQKNVQLNIQNKDYSEQYEKNKLNKQNKQNAHNLNMKIMKILTSQYNLISSYGPSLNMYTIASLQNYFIWNIIIYVRNGFYKGAKVKLEIKFYQNINDKANETNQNNILQIQYVKCKMNRNNSQVIYHSMINSKTGEIDWKRLYQFYSIKRQVFNSLNQQQGLYPLFKGLSCMFSEHQLLKCTDSFHSSAGRLYKSRNQRFIEKVYESILIIQQEQNQNGQQQEDQFLGLQSDKYLEYFDNQLINPDKQNQLIKNKLNQILLLTNLTNDQKAEALYQQLITGN